MSSATSIEAEPADSTFRPWQFFLLAGMLSATAVVIVATGQSAASIIVLSLTVVAASFVAMGVFRALAPLVALEAVDEPAVAIGRQRATLEREKTLVLRSIKELEFDYAMGKIAKADFEEMGGKLRARAIRLMRQLDAGAGYKPAIEQELAARLGRAAGEPSQMAGAEPPPATPASPTCECGAANDPDARFCKICGARLATT